MTLNRFWSSDIFFLICNRSRDLLAVILNVRDSWNDLRASVELKNRMWVLVVWSRNLTMSWITLFLLLLCSSGKRLLPHFNFLARQLFLDVYGALGRIKVWRNCCLKWSDLLPVHGTVWMAQTDRQQLDIQQSCRALVSKINFFSESVATIVWMFLIDCEAPWWWVCGTAFDEYVR